jgi:signal peptidase II
VTTYRRSSRAIALCVAATVALLAADLGTKEWAQDALSSERTSAPPPLCSGRGNQRVANEGIVWIPGYLEMQYAENCGAAFGLLRDADDWVRRVVFGVAAFGAAVALMWMFVMGKGGRFFAWSVPFVVSGAVGNLVDRVRYGYVVDFIRFHIYDKFEYPTFNVADIAIVVGVALLFLDGLRKESDATPVEQQRGAGKSGAEGKSSTAQAAGEASEESNEPSAPAEERASDG